MATSISAQLPSSPRLPSPPPIPELQIGPKSPTLADSVIGGQIELGGQSSIDAGATRRIRPGTKNADMASGPPIIPLGELDSAFQLQEHLKALFYSYTRPAGSTRIVPLTRETAIQLAQPPQGVDRPLWLYELCRLLTNNLNTVIVAFFSDQPPCSAATCPEMRASEWQYLCAVHDPPKSCCAIDYCCHTLDWAGNMLTSTKHFPSRLSLGVAGEGGGGSQQGLRHLTNIFRRLYRIFAHAWFQHRAMFWQVEQELGLYLFFKTVCDFYRLIPEDSYTVPPEAEGLEADSSEETTTTTMLDIPATKKEEDGPQTSRISEAETQQAGAAPTQRRSHKHTPSTGVAVNTVPEEDESEELSKVGIRKEDANAKSLISRDAAAETPDLPVLPASLQELASFSEKPGTQTHVREPTQIEGDSSSIAPEREDAKAEAKELEKEESLPSADKVKEEEKEHSPAVKTDPDAETVVEGSKESISQPDPDKEAVIEGSKTKTDPDSEAVIEGSKETVGPAEGEPGTEVKKESE